MSTPLSLSDEEIDVLHRLAAPIAWGQRQQFLQAVTDALARVRSQVLASFIGPRARSNGVSAERAGGDRDRRRATPSGRDERSRLRKLHIMPGQRFLHVYSVQGWLEPRGSLAAAVSTALGGL